jgi:hypothetical protein
LLRSWLFSASRSGSNHTARVIAQDRMIGCAAGTQLMQPRSICISDFGSPSATRMNRPNRPGGEDTYVAWKIAAIASRRKQEWPPPRSLVTVTSRS